ncbi:MAG: type II secretion system F family protein [bacterium]
MILLMLCATILTGISAFIIVYETIDLVEHGSELYKNKVMDQVRELEELYVKMEPRRLFYLNIVSCFAVFAISSILLSSFVIGLICAPIGLIISRLWINFMRRRRIKLFDEQFIDAIGVISNALKSGLSLQQAIARVADQYPAPLSQELSMVGKEVTLGVPLEQALTNLSKRIGSEDLDLFVTATGVVKDAGGNLSEMFDSIADTIRERNTIQGKIKALTSQGRLQGIVIGFMPVVLGFILYKLDPNLIMPLFRDPIGWFILFIIVLFEAIGAFFIVKIIRIDV